MLPGLILIGLVILIALLVIGFYNSVIQLKIKVDEAWADIDTFLKQRYDMIPNLVSTVKGYMKHEADTLEKVTQLRAQVADAGSMKERAVADNALTNTLKTLFAVAENYPDLKANQNFLQLQSDLTTLEDKLQNSRRFYNATVRNFNTKIQMFPGSVIAGLFNFTSREFFEAVDQERENVKVSFDEAPVQTEEAEAKAARANGDLTEEERMAAVKEANVPNADAAVKAEESEESEE